MKALDLKHFLPYQLSLLSNVVSNGIARTYQPRHGLNVTQWRVMAIVGPRAGISAQEITKRSAMDKVAVSRAVATLTDRSLIRRDTDGSDRRRALLSLTPEGVAVYDLVIPAALQFEQQLLESLNTSEREVLHSLVEKLTERAQELSLEPHDVA